MEDTSSKVEDVKGSIRKSFLQGIHSVLDWFQEHVIIITLFLASLSALPEIAMLIGLGPFSSYFKYPEKIVSVLFSCSIAMFTGVLFSAVTKSDYFMKIYKDNLKEIIKNWRKDDIKDKKYILDSIKKETIDEVENIFSKKIEAIYTEKDSLFFKNLSTERQVQIWNNVSDAILINGFPKINNKIKDHIFKTYFPKNNTFYYSDYHITLDYRIIDIGKKIISIRDERYYTLIPSEDSRQLNHEICNSVETDQLIKYDWNLININGTCYDIGTHTIDNGILKIGIDNNIVIDGKNVTRSYYNLNKPVDKKENIQIHAIITREYKLSHETSILKISFKKFVDNMHVQIKYDTKLNMEFSKTGLLGEFVNRGETSGLINKEFNDIVFPGQGFIISVGLE